MKEIGSEFWSVPTTSIEHSLFDHTYSWFISGRSALKAIIEKLQNVKTVELPSWCCDSMIKPFLEAGIKVEFYPVIFKEKLMILPKYDCDAILVMDYFGFKSVVNESKDYNGIVIRDVTHSVFSYKFTDADYYFGSLRKWCGFWTGGFAWSKKNDIQTPLCKTDDEYIHLREKAMQMKEAYIQDDNHEKYKEKDYLHVFDKAESKLEYEGILPASDRDIDIVRKLDIGLIKEQRRKNAKVLMSELENLLIFTEMREEECPLFVPIMVSGKNRDSLRKHLINNNIFCPVHWNKTDLHVLGKEEQELYDNELSLVCDQRYTEDDMKRFVKIIKQFQ